MRDSAHVGGLLTAFDANQQVRLESGIELFWVFGFLTMTGVQLLRSILVVVLIGLSGCAHVGVFEPFREVECLERARVSLKDAVAAAEARGGKTIDADYREVEEMGCLVNDPGDYDITLLSGGRIEVLSVDARSGEIGPREQAGVMNALLGTGNRFEGSSADMARLAPRLSINISQAIDIAQRQGGKAMAAWIEGKDGKAGYTVKVVEKGRVRVTWVDGA